MAPHHASRSTSRSHKAFAQWGHSALRWLLGIVAAFIVLLALAIVVITNWDWNSARPWIAKQVSEATGRTFSIQGDLIVDWHWPQPLEQGWRHWIPGVTVQANHLSLGNPPGFAVEEAPDKGSKELPAIPNKESTAKRDASVAIQAMEGSSKTRLAVQAASKPGSAASAASATQAEHSALQGDAERSEQADAQEAERLIEREGARATVEPPARSADTMGTIARATATLRLLPLLSRTVALDTVMLTAPDIVLGRTRDGANNWTFQSTKERTGSAWNLSIGQLIVRDGWLGYTDGERDLALRARIDTFRPEALDDDNRYGVHVTLQGRYGKALVEGEALAGPILSLRNKVIDYPLRVKARAGGLHAQAEGMLANPRALSGLDLQVALSGSSMADLYALTGLVLPNTPAFKTHGRLLGSLEPGKAVWEYRDFDGVVGASDLHGSLTYTSAHPRARLEGRMLSKKLRLVDLGPVVGRSEAREKQLERKGRILPDDAFDTGRWNAMDLDLAFTGEKIIRPESLPIENLSTRAVLKDAVLHLSPLRFGVAKGKIQSDVTLDSRSKPLKVKAQGTAESMQLSALFPKVELMHKSFGRLDGGFSLTAQGNSIASMLGHSAGDARFYIRDGRFSKEMLDLAALNLGSVVVTKLFGADKEVHLRCAVVDLGIRDGIATTRNAKLSTEEAIVEATGAINMRDERLDLRIKPESLKWKFFSLRTPLYVQGSFADPKVGVEPGPLLLRAGAAVAAAVVAPAALALVPITVPAAEDDADCKTLLAPPKKP
ncbi:AsmA family protein [Diaphorobacter sp.]|uniref:AsmA family protein n=1 Tax=Diaphorobacter sp. TaxID=1934310 RepID=UPI0028B13799|nr:AsmA family protein [Diaphorobacter sp.]